MRVALFITCFNDAMYPQTGQAVVRLLERLGHEVDFPMAQTCCGQMHINTGYYREAVPLAERLAGGTKRADGRFRDERRRSAGRELSCLSSDGRSCA